MGDYNPRAPDLLGLEWVPIRDEDTTFSPTVNSVEYGHGFTLAATQTLQDARWYLHEMPANTDDMVYLAQVYPRGLEDASGPIRRVVIPVDSGATTGVTLSSARSIAGILLTPQISDYLLFDTDPTVSAAILGFDASSYTVLTGKRILAVNLLLGAHRFFNTEDRTVGPFIALHEAPVILTAGKNYSNGDEIPEGGDLAGDQTIRIRLGDVFPFWQTPQTREILPWIYPTDIGRFDQASGSRLYIKIATGQNFGAPPANGIMYLWYAALEVLFCEETRVALGGTGPYPAGGQDDVTYGANLITMRTWPARGLLPALGAGDYTVTLSVGDQGGSQPSFAGYPLANALRELYDIPPHPGLQLNLPYPPEDHVGDAFEAIQTHILPQISMHTSGAPLTELHAYGRQGPAPVYDGIFATQDIYDDISGVAADYPQVRFYARKYDTTTVPLKLDSTNVTGAGIAVQITPAEHDALPEIVDGWKECTLRFPTAPSMGAVAGFPAWRFSSVGEVAGSRWEVLAACAPAISGIPGNLLQQVVPAAQRLGTATYQPTSGDTVELTWMSPYATGAVADPDCDAVLIFSQDPPTVTGIGLSQLTQTITGIGLDCGSLPCCIPTGIGYNRITWGLPVNTGVADDTFDRTVAAGGWGTASDGKTWTTSGTAGDFSVDPDLGGLITPTATATDRIVWVDVGGPDQQVRVAVRVSEAAESGSLRRGAVARLTDASNFYWAELRDTTTEVQLFIRRTVAGVAADVASTTVRHLLPTFTTPRWVEIQVIGSTLRARAWDGDEGDPPWWQLEATDANLATGNNTGCFARDETGAASTTFYFTAFTVRPPDFAFGGLELQRFDTMTGTFDTIMLASSPACTGFSDFEPRVGVDSVYRIRRVNSLNFAGPWSSMVTGGPAAPGVSGGCSDQTGALIFTSNADQTGQHNCAYIMQWPNTPEEIFQLLESGRVSFQELHNRDGRVAFHGTERGLEAFSRTLLIHAGAVDPARLADVHTLRDLAWADLPYVAVRDDLGNRWYSNVRVPDVAHRRTSGNDLANTLASVDIVETTQTPCIVDPSA